MKPLTRQQIETLVRAIEQTHEHEFNCPQCQSHLDEFTERQLAGRPLDELLTRVECHLALCPDCREEFLALEKILREGT
jgi:uncharacterized protein with PIN domain